MPPRCPGVYGRGCGGALRLVRWTEGSYFFACSVSGVRTSSMETPGCLPCPLLALPGPAHASGRVCLFAHAGASLRVDISTSPLGHPRRTLSATTASTRRHISSPLSSASPWAARPRPWQSARSWVPRQQLQPAAGWLLCWRQPGWTCATLWVSRWCCRCRRCLCRHQDRRPGRSRHQRQRPQYLVNPAQVWQAELCRRRLPQQRLRRLGMRRQQWQRQCCRKVRLHPIRQQRLMTAALLQLERLQERLSHLAMKRRPSRSRRSSLCPTSHLPSRHTRWSLRPCSRCCSRSPITSGCMRSCSSLGGRAASAC